MLFNFVCSHISPRDPECHLWLLSTTVLGGRGGQILFLSAHTGATRSRHVGPVWIQLVPCRFSGPRPWLDRLRSCHFRWPLLV